VRLYKSRVNLGGRQPLFANQGLARQKRGLLVRVCSRSEKAANYLACFQLAENRRLGDKNGKGMAEAGKEFQGF